MSKKLSEMSLEELWQLFPIFLTEHNQHWAEWYDEEKEILGNLLPTDTEFYHIGSTAINGIWAKPIVDILIVVSDGRRLKDTADALQNNGYIIMSENDKRIS